MTPAQYARDYYGDNDGYVCAWLRNLISAGHLPAGEVHEKDIRKVEARELAGFRRVHFFAGIGGWAHALQLAGWPEDRPVWTASCPCQPFSAAGRTAGVLDERHLWPALLRLIAECRPATILGEQVASRAGREWLAGVRVDLEQLGYAVGAADLPAASVGAPHIRQRLYWVAHSQGGGQRIDRGASRIPGHDDECGTAGGVAHAENRGARRGEPRVEGQAGCGRDRPAIDGETGRMEYATCGGTEPAQQPRCGSGAIEDGRLGNTSGTRLAQRQIAEIRRGIVRHEGSASPETGLSCGLADADGRIAGDGGLQRGGQHGQQPQDGGSGFWSAFDLIPCRDGKSRRIEPGSFPLAHGIPSRVGRLRAYGNAIVPPLAVEFVRACMDWKPGVQHAD